MGLNEGEECVTAAMNPEWSLSRFILCLFCLHKTKNPLHTKDFFWYQIPDKQNIKNIISYNQLQFFTDYFSWLSTPRKEKLGANRRWYFKQFQPIEKNNTSDGSSIKLSPNEKESSIPACSEHNTLDRFPS